jgi:hypothetical protein
LAIKNKEALSYLKGLSEDWGVGKIAENLHSSPFITDPSNETTLA